MSKCMLTPTQIVEGLENCKAVIIDGSALCYPCISEVTGEASNEIACFRWQEENGEDYSLVLSEESCAGAYLDESGLLIVDTTEGFECSIQLLIPWEGN